MANLGIEASKFCQLPTKFSDYFADFSSKIVFYKSYNELAILWLIEVGKNTFLNLVHFITLFCTGEICMYDDLNLLILASNSSQHKV